MRPHLLTLAGMLVLATGCDVLYGVRRHAAIDSIPDLNCIASTMSRVPGIAIVERQTSSDGRLHQFLFRGSPESHIIGVAQVSLASSKAMFENTLFHIGERPRQEEVDATRPVMRAIEHAVERECHVGNLSSSIEEHCRGVSCDAIQ